MHMTSIAIVHYKMMFRFVFHSYFLLYTQLYSSTYTFKVKHAQHYTKSLLAIVLLILISLLISLYKNSPILYVSEKRIAADGYLSCWLKKRFDLVYSRKKRPLIRLGNSGIVCGKKH